jgi:hypothetical protein
MLQKKIVTVDAGYIVALFNENDMSAIPAGKT